MLLTSASGADVIVSVSHVSRQKVEKIPASHVCLTAVFSNLVLCGSGLK